MIEINSLWNEAKTSLSAKLQAISFEVWIAKLEPVCIIGHTLVLLTPSQSSKNTIVKNYREPIAVSLKEVNPVISDVRIIVEAEKEECLKQQDYAVNDELVGKADEKPANDGFSFNKKYTFDNFVVGSSNEVAAAAAQAVAEHPGGRFNPLFIYGASGLGKTHLLHAIGNYIVSNFPSKRILYTTTDKYVSDFVEAIRGEVKASNSFREKYRSVDVLMIDDVQMIASRSGSQEALFSTFNDLYQSDKQIIISSDRPPKDISPLEERLRTRFQWGLIEEIQAPDIETRIAILTKKAEINNFYLSDEVATFIASNIESNIRDMEGLLNKVMFYSQLSGQQVTSVSVAQDALKDYIDKKDDHFDSDDIITTTCKYFGVARTDVLGKKKNKEIVEPRMIAMYLICDMLSVPLVAIGNLFGGRDHTTVIHARDKITEQIKTDNKLKIQVNDIKDMLYNR